MGVQYGCNLECNSTQNECSPVRRQETRLGIRHACGPAVPISAASQHTFTLKFAARPDYIIFDRHANIVAQSQEEFPQYYPNPGYAHTSQYNTVPLLALLFQSLRWHGHDATEIQEVCDCDKVVEL